MPLFICIQDRLTIGYQPPVKTSNKTIYDILYDAFICLFSVPTYHWLPASSQKQVTIRYMIYCMVLLFCFYSGPTYHRLSASSQRQVTRLYMIYCMMPLFCFFSGPTYHRVPASSQRQVTRRYMIYYIMPLLSLFRTDIPLATSLQSKTSHRTGTYFMEKKMTLELFSSLLGELQRATILTI